jgi:hypothetical protein
MTESRRSKPADVSDQQMAKIEAFVVRARRIAAHSLAADPQVLLDLNRGELKVVLEPDGTARLCQKYPPEEQLESLAARVRPVMLDKEPVYLPGVLKALGYFLREAPEHLETCQALRQRWEDVDPRSGKLAAYRVEHNRTDGIASTSVASDSELALAWLYGDVIHADPQTTVGDISLDERYRSAAHAVARIAVFVRDVLGFILWLHDERLLQISDVILQQQVVVESPDRDQVGRAFTAALGSEMPAPGEPFGAGWTRMGPHGGSAEAETDLP